VVALGQTDLECQARLDLVGKHVGDSLVEVGEDLHSELRLDAALGDEVVEGVCEGAAQTVCCQLRPQASAGAKGMQYLLRR
jgi:carbamoylphosphate synthase small subunit